MRLAVDDGSRARTAGVPWREAPSTVCRGRGKPVLSGVAEPCGARSERLAYRPLAARRAALRSCDFAVRCSNRFRGAALRCAAVQAVIGKTRATLETTGTTATDCFAAGVASTATSTTVNGAETS